MSDSVLKKYTIEIDAKIDKAEQMISDLEKQMTSFSKDKMFSQAIASEMERAQASIEELKKFTNKSFKDIQKNINNINPNELGKKFDPIVADLNKSIESISDQIVKLNDVVKSSDGDKFNTFIVKMQKPLSELQTTIQRSTDVFAASIDKLINKLGNLQKIEEAPIQVLSNNLEQNVDAFKKWDNQIDKEISKVVKKLKSLEKEDMNLNLESRLSLKNVNTETLDKLEGELSKLFNLINGYDPSVINEKLTQSLSPDINLHQLEQIYEHTKKQFNQGFRGKYNKNDVTITLDYKIADMGDSDVAALADSIQQNVVEKIEKKVREKGGFYIPLDEDATRKNIVSTLNNTINDLNLTKDNEIAKITLHFNTDLTASEITSIAKKIEEELPKTDFKFNLGEGNNSINLTETGLAKDGTLQEIKNILLSGITFNGSNVNIGSSPNAGGLGAINRTINVAPLNNATDAVNEVGNEIKTVTKVVGDLSDETRELIENIKADISERKEDSGYNFHDSVKAVGNKNVKSSTADIIDVSSSRKYSKELYDVANQEIEKIISKLIHNKIDEAKELLLSSQYMTSEVPLNIGGKEELYNIYSKTESAKRQAELTKSFDALSQEITKALNEVSQRFSDSLKEQSIAYFKYIRNDTKEAAQANYEDFNKLSQQEKERLVSDFQRRNYTEEEIKKSNKNNVVTLDKIKSKLNFDTEEGRLSLISLVPKIIDSWKTFVIEQIEYEFGKKITKDNTTNKTVMTNSFQAVSKTTGQHKDEYLEVQKEAQGRYDEIHNKTSKKHPLQQAYEKAQEEYQEASKELNEINKIAENQISKQDNATINNVIQWLQKDRSNLTSLVKKQQDLNTELSSLDQEINKLQGEAKQKGLSYLNKDKIDSLKARKAELKSEIANTDKQITDEDKEYKELNKKATEQLTNSINNKLKAVGSDKEVTQDQVSNVLKFLKTNDSHLNNSIQKYNQAQEKLQQFNQEIEKQQNNKDLIIQTRTSTKEELDTLYNSISQTTLDINNEFITSLNDLNKKLKKGGLKEVSESNLINIKDFSRNIESRLISSLNDFNNELIKRGFTELSKDSINNPSKELLDFLNKQDKNGSYVNASLRKQYLSLIEKEKEKNAYIEQYNNVLMNSAKRDSAIERNQIISKRLLEIEQSGKNEVTPISEDEAEKIYNQEFESLKAERDKQKNIIEINKEATSKYMQYIKNIAPALSGISSASDIDFYNLQRLVSQKSFEDIGAANIAKLFGLFKDEQVEVAVKQGEDKILQDMSVFDAKELKTQEFNQAKAALNDAKNKLNIALSKTIEELMVEIIQEQMSSALQNVDSAVVMDQKMQSYFKAAQKRAEEDAVKQLIGQSVFGQDKAKFGMMSTASKPGDAANKMLGKTLAEQLKKNPKGFSSISTEDILREYAGTMLQDTDISKLAEIIKAQAEDAAKATEKLASIDTIGSMKDNIVKILEIMKAQAQTRVEVVDSSIDELEKEKALITRIQILRKEDLTDNIQLQDELNQKTIEYENSVRNIDYSQDNDGKLKSKVDRLLSLRQQYQRSIISGYDEITNGNMTEDRIKQYEWYIRNIDEELKSIPKTPLKDIVDQKSINDLETINEELSKLNRQKKQIQNEYNKNQQLFVGEFFESINSPNSYEKKKEKYLKALNTINQYRNQVDLSPKDVNNYAEQITKGSRTATKQGIPVYQNNYYLLDEEMKEWSNAYNTVAQLAKELYSYEIAHQEEFIKQEKVGLFVNQQTTKEIEAQNEEYKQRLDYFDKFGIYNSKANPSNVIDLTKAGSSNKVPYKHINTSNGIQNEAIIENVNEEIKAAAKLSDEELKRQLENWKAVRKATQKIVDSLQASKDLEQELSLPKQSQDKEAIKALKKKAKYLENQANKYAQSAIDNVIEKYTQAIKELEQKRDSYADTEENKATRDNLQNQIYDLMRRRSYYSGKGGRVDGVPLSDSLQDIDNARAKLNAAEQKEEQALAELEKRSKELTDQIRALRKEEEELVQAIQLHRSAENFEMDGKKIKEEDIPALKQSYATDNPFFNKYINKSIEELEKSAAEVHKQIRKTANQLNSNKTNTTQKDSQYVTNYLEALENRTKAQNRLSALEEKEAVKEDVANRLRDSRIKEYQENVQVVAKENALASRNIELYETLLADPNRERYISNGTATVKKPINQGKDVVKGIIGDNPQSIEEYANAVELLKKSLKKFASDPVAVQQINKAVSDFEKAQKNLIEQTIYNTGLAQYRLEHSKPSQQEAEIDRIKSQNSIKYNLNTYAGLDQTIADVVKEFNRLQKDLNNNVVLLEEQNQLYENLKAILATSGLVDFDDKTNYAKSKVDINDALNNPVAYATNSFVQRALKLQVESQEVPVQTESVVINGTEVSNGSLATEEKQDSIVGLLNDIIKQGGLSEGTVSAVQKAFNLNADNKNLTKSDKATESVITSDKSKYTKFIDTLLNSQEKAIKTTFENINSNNLRVKTLREELKERGYKLEGNKDSGYEVKKIQEVSKAAVQANEDLNKAQKEQSQTAKAASQETKKKTAAEKEASKQQNELIQNVLNLSSKKAYKNNTIARNEAYKDIFKEHPELIDSIAFKQSGKSYNAISKTGNDYKANSEEFDRFTQQVLDSWKRTTDQQIESFKSLKDSDFKKELNNLLTKSISAEDIAKVIVAGSERGFVLRNKQNGSQFFDYNDEQRARFEVKASAEEFVKSLKKTSLSLQEMREAGVYKRDVKKELDSQGYSYTDIKGQGFENITSKIGKQADQEIANGITENTSTITKATQDAIQKGVIDTSKEVLDEHSPSKTAEQIGLYYDQGLGNGIKKGIPGIVSAIKEALQAGVIKQEDVDELFKYLNGKRSVKDTIFGTIQANEDIKEKADLSYKNLYNGLTQYNEALLQTKQNTDALAESNEKLKQSSKQKYTAREKYAMMFDPSVATEKQLKGALGRYEDAQTLKRTTEISAWEPKVEAIQQRLSQIDAERKQHLEDQKQALLEIIKFEEGQNSSLQHANDIAEELGLHLDDIKDVSVKNNGLNNIWSFQSKGQQYSVKEYFDENDSLQYQITSVKELDDKYTKMRDTIKGLNSVLNKYNEISSYRPAMFGELASQVKEAQGLITELTDIQKTGTADNIEDITQKVTRLKEIALQINGKNGISGVVTQLNDEQISGLDARKKALSDLASQYANGEIQSYKFAKGNTELTYSVKTADDQLQTYRMTIDKTAQVTQGLISETKYVGVLGRTIQSFGKKFGELLRYTTASLSFWRVINMVKSGINVVKELDTAMTEMRKVSNDTEEALQSFAESSHAMAQEIGSTAAIIQNSAADWMRLGYNIEEAAELAKNTSILMNVSEFDSIDAATESMVAMVQAFKDANQDVGELSLEIIDKLNNIGNNFSISTSDLAKSLQRSSGALIAAGNDLDEAIALTTAANAIIQDPESTGSALKVISMRIRGTSVKELEEAGEDTEGLIDTVSKLEKKVKELTAVNGELGVSIVDANGNYRDTYEILQDIADVWDDIEKADKADGKNRQAALLEALAGKTRSQALASLLQNPDMLREVYESSKVSEGSAAKENEEYLASIEAHIKVLQAKWQEFWNSAINRDQINWIIDRAGDLLDIIKKIGSLPTLGILFGGVSRIRKIANPASNTQDITKGKSRGVFGSILDTFFPNNTIGKIKQEGSADKISESVNKVTESLDEAEKEGSIFAQVGTKIKTKWKGAYDALGITSKQLGLLIGGLTAAAIAVGAVIAAFNKWNVTVKEVDSEIDEINSKIDSLKSQIKELDAIGYRNAQENEKLQSLQQELKLQEKLLEIETKRKYQELTENNLEGFFDRENLKTQLDYESQKDKEKYSPEDIIPGLTNYFRYGLSTNDLEKRLEKNKEKLRSKQEEYDTLPLQTMSASERQELSSKKILKLEEEQNKVIKERDEITQDIAKDLTELQEKDLTYLQNITTLNNAIDSGLLSDAEKKNAQDLLTQYQALHEEVSSIITETQKGLGTYDYSDAIKGTLSNIEGAESELVKLYNQGKINAQNLYDVLDKEIATALQSAQLEAADVLRYIQNIADPNKVWRDETRSELFSTLGTAASKNSKYGNVNTGKLLEDAGFDINNESHLQAYLDIKTSFGSETEYWTLDKWIEEIQNALNKSDLEVDVKTNFKDLMKRSTGKDEEGKDKTFGDDIDNYTQKIGQLEEYLDKLKNGTYTDNDLLSIAKDFGVTGKSVDELRTKLEQMSEKELETINAQIDQMMEEYEDEPQIVRALDSVKESCKELYDQAIETNNALKQNLDVKSDIWGSKVGMDQLATMYKDIKDGGDFDWSSIVNNDSFREEFGRFENEYNNLINSVFAHPKNIKANKQAFDELVDAYLKDEHVLDGLTEAEKEHAKRLLDSIGVTNSAEMVEAELTSQRIQSAIAQAQANQKIAESNAQNIKDEEGRRRTIERSLEAEKKAISELQVLSEAQRAYYLEKQLLGKTSADFTSGDIEQLNLIVEALGLGSEAWDAYYDARQQLEYAKKNNAGAYEQIRKNIEAELESRLDAVRENLGNIAKSYKVDLDDAGTEAADAYLEAFNKELGELDALKDAGVIGEKEYLERLRSLYIKYFSDKKKYYQQFKQYEKQYLEGLKGLYESAISASITLLNDQKDEIEKQKEETLKTLEEQRDSEKKAIQESIDGLEDEKEALEKANEEREKAMNLQKAQYELERAHSQRTRLIYKNGQMQYVNDSAAVRDAKNNVDDLLRQRAVDELDDKIDDLNKKLEEVEDHYTKLIEETEKMYDEQIQGVQNLIDMWEKLQHQAELVEVYEALGNFGITAQDILSGNIAIFNQIKDGYTGVFAGLSDDIGAVAQAFGTTADQAIVFKNALLGYDAATQAFSDMDVKLKDVGYAAKDAAKAIGDDNDFQTPSGGISAVGATAKLGTTVASVTDDAITRFNNWHNSITSCTEDLEALTNQVAKMNMPKYDANGFKLNTNFKGTAYANGNWSAKSKGTNGTSLVGELGTELVVDSKTGQWHTVGDRGAEFTHIKANDIVFNHKQTKDLLKNGKINSRGKAYASGNNNKFTSLSPEELSKYTKLSFTADLAEKLDFGNQKLMNIDKTVSTISNNKTVNNNPVINVNNPTFTCTGVNSEQVVAEIQAAFTGLFSNAYQRSMTTK